jgi:hypothetical protein
MAQNFEPYKSDRGIEAECDKRTVKKLPPSGLGEYRVDHYSRSPKSRKQRNGSPCQPDLGLWIGWLMSNFLYRLLAISIIFSIHIFY